MINVFISYSHADELYRVELEKHLSILKRNGHINTWTDRKIIAGENWGNKISEALENAHIILLLISADFLASDYCYDIEMKKAMERHQKQEAVVAPVILRFCDWAATPFSVLQALPAGGKPIKDWEDTDKSFLSVTDGLKALLDKLNKKESIDSPNKLLPPTLLQQETWHLYGDKKINQLLSTPFFPETFLGREDDFKKIHTQLFEGDNSMLLVNGEGGIGKTALAAQYFLNHQNNYQHLAWVFAETSIADALLTLGHPLQTVFPETSTSDERMQLLLEDMRNLHKPCLLVIDNANDLEELEKNYQYLRTCTNFHVLLTTRITEFEHAQTHKIEGLPEDKALELFKKHYPKHRAEEDEIFKQIRSAVGGNTLVMELLAKNLFLLNRLKTNYTLANLLTDLQQTGLLALTKTKEVGVWYQSKNALRKEKPEAIIKAMYDLGKLSDAEIQLLSVFAVLPAENIEYIILEQLLKGMDSFDDNLISLAKKGWLDRNEVSNNFKISPVVQEIIKTRGCQLFKDCENLINNLIDKLDYSHGTGIFLNADYKEASLYARYAEMCVSNLKKVNNRLAVLCERLGNYYDSINNLLKAKFYYELYNQLEQELLKLFPDEIYSKNGLAISYEKLGDISTTLGNLQQALHFYELELQLFEQIYQAMPDNVKFKGSVAIAYFKIGETHFSLGNLKSSLTYYENYNRFEKELCESWPDNTSFKNSLAISYNRLGEIYTQLDNLPKALIFYQSEIILAKELHELSPDNVRFKHGLAISYQWLGMIHYKMCSWRNALSYYKSFCSLEKELYSLWPENAAFKEGVAIAYQKIGDVNIELGKMETAHFFYQKCHLLHKDLYEISPSNVEYKKNLADSYLCLGNVNVNLENKQNAYNFYLLFNKFSKELYSDWPDNVTFKNLLAISHMKLGFANERTSDRSLAKNNFEIAADFLQNLIQNSPDHAEFRKNLNEVLKKLKEY